MASMKPEKEIARLKRQLETERSENTRLEERLRAKDNDLDIAEARVMEFKKSESTAQSEILLAKQRIGVLESLASTTSEELLGTLARVERENANLARSLEHANDRIRTLLEDRDPIREARDLLKTQLTEMDQKFDALSGEHGKMKDERNRMSKKYKELLDAKRALEVRVETHNSIKEKLEEDRQRLEMVKEDLQLRIDKLENLVLRVGSEKREIQAQMDDLGDQVKRLREEQYAVYQSHKLLHGKLDYPTQEYDKVTNGIITKEGEETCTFKKLFTGHNKAELDLEHEKWNHRHKYLKLKYKEKVENGPFDFKGPTSGQFMTNEQLFELHQKSVQVHKTLERKYNSLFIQRNEYIGQRQQDIERYNALRERYNKAKEETDKAEKDLAEAVLRHYQDFAR